MSGGRPPWVDAGTVTSVAAASASSSGTICVRFRVSMLPDYGPMRAIVTTGAPVREGRYDFCLFGVTSPESRSEERRVGKECRCRGGREDGRESEETER